MWRWGRRLGAGGVGCAGAGFAFLQWQGSQCEVVDRKAVPGRRRGEKGETVAVIGGGVIGVSTAHALMREGFRVTLVEPQGIGEQCSQANAGSLRTSSYVPLASPGAVKRLIWAVLTGDQIYQFRWGSLVDPFHFPLFASWGTRFLGASFTPEVGKRGTVFLREQSAQCLESIRRVASEEGFADAYDAEHGAMLNVYTDASAYTGGAKSAVASKKDWGKQVLPLEKAETLAAEPSLLPVEHLVHGGVQADEDEHGDCGKFTKCLWAACERRGATLLKSRAQALENDGEVIKRLRLADGTALEADHYVVCAGAHSAPLAQTAGVYLPIYPVKGYSITVPQAAGGPERSLLTIEPMQMYITRFGNDRVRFASIAEFAGYDMSVSKSCVDEIKARMVEMYPKVVWDFDRADILVGGRPMTPDDMPIISGTKHKNLFVNSGQGSFGWRLAYLSAELLSSVVTQTTAPYGQDMDMFSLARFKSLRATPPGPPAGAKQHHNRGLVPG